MINKVAENQHIQAVENRTELLLRLVAMLGQVDL